MARVIRLIGEFTIPPFRTVRRICGIAIIFRGTEPGAPGNRVKRSGINRHTRQKPLGAGQRRTGRADSCLAFLGGTNGQPNLINFNLKNVRPGTNTKLAATSPEIICPFGIRAGSVLGVPDRPQEHQHRMRSEKPFQHLLSPELARTYSCCLVSKVWIKQ